MTRAVDEVDNPDDQVDNARSVDPEDGVGRTRQRWMWGEKGYDE